MGLRAGIREDVGEELGLDGVGVLMAKERDVDRR